MPPAAQRAWQIRPSGSWLAPLQALKALVLAALTLSAAAPWPAGNHLFSALARGLFGAPGHITGFIGEHLWALGVLTLLFFTDLGLLLYLRNRGARFLKESLLVAAIYGPWHLALFRSVAGAALLMLLLALHGLLALPLLMAVAAEPLGFLRTALLCLLVWGVMDPAALDGRRRLWLLALSLAAVTNLAGMDFSWEIHMGVFLITGAVLICAVKLIFFPPDRHSSRVHHPLGLKQVRIWCAVTTFLLLLGTLMGEDAFTGSFGLLFTIGAVLWWRRRPGPMDVSRAWRWLLALSALPFMWHEVRTHPNLTAREKDAVGPPGQGALMLFSHSSGSAAGIGPLGNSLWVRQADTWRLAFTIDLPRNFRPVSGAFLHSKLVLLAGGAMVGVSKENRTAVYDNLNELILYGAEGGLKQIWRTRAYDCDLLGGAVPAGVGGAWVVCNRPHGLIHLDLRFGTASPLILLSGGNRPQSHLMWSGGDLLVSEGGMGAGVWRYTPRQSDLRLNFPTRPKTVFYPTGPVGAMCDPSDQGTVWLWGTPFGALMRWDAGLPGGPVYVPPRQGGWVWRPKTCGQTPMGFRVFEYPFSAAIRGFQRTGLGVAPRTDWDIPGDSGLTGMAPTREHVWLSTIDRVYRIPLKR